MVRTRAVEGCFGGSERPGSTENKFLCPGEKSVWISPATKPLTPASDVERVDLGAGEAIPTSSPSLPWYLGNFLCGLVTRTNGRKTKFPAPDSCPFSLGHDLLLICSSPTTYFLRSMYKLGTVIRPFREGGHLVPTLSTHPPTALARLPTHTCTCNAEARRWTRPSISSSSSVA